jgi:hypothetical protein
MGRHRVTIAISTMTFAIVRLLDCALGPVVLPWPFYVAIFGGGVLILSWPLLERK